jgi:TP901-1 family phage major tail protein
LRLIFLQEGILEMTTSSVTAQKGRLFLLKIATSASPSNFVTAAGVRATDITINGNPVDITNKDSDGWRELLPDSGVKQVDITFSGVMNDSDQLKAVQDAALAGGAILPMELTSGSGDYFTGEFSVATFKRSGQHSGEETFEATINSHGAVTHTDA